MEKLSEKIGELPFPEEHEKKVELQKIIEKLQDGIDDLEEEADDLDYENEDLKDKVKRLEGDIDELEDDLKICNRPGSLGGGWNSYGEEQLNQMLLEIWQNRIRFAFDRDKMKIIEDISKM